MTKIKWKIKSAWTEEGSNVIELPEDAQILSYRQHHNIENIQTGMRLDFEHHELIYLTRCEEVSDG